MSVELTEPQQQALDARTEEPLRLVDPRNRASYVLVRADIFERMKALVQDDSLDMRQVAVLVDAAMREEDANDPALESYQKKPTGWAHDDILEIEFLDELARLRQDDLERTLREDAEEDAGCSSTSSTPTT
jgi:hypothetical protein